MIIGKNFITLEKGVHETAKELSRFINRYIEVFEERESNDFIGGRYVEV